MSAAAKWLVQSLAGRRQSTGPGDAFSGGGGGSGGGSGAGSSTRLVDPAGPTTATSTPRFAGGAAPNAADLDEIAIVSNAVQGGGHIKYGAGNVTGSANGPRYVPGESPTLSFFFMNDFSSKKNDRKNNTLIFPYLQRKYAMS